MSIKIRINDAAIREFASDLNDLLAKLPSDKAGRVRDCIFRNGLLLGVATTSDDWPDLEVNVRPSGEIVLAIRRLLGPEVARELKGALGDPFGRRTMRVGA